MVPADDGQMVEIFFIDTIWSCLHLVPIYSAELHLQTEVKCVGSNWTIEKLDVK